MRIVELPFDLTIWGWQSENLSGLSKQDQELFKTSSVNLAFNLSKVILFEELQGGLNQIFEVFGVASHNFKGDISDFDLAAHALNIREWRLFRVFEKGWVEDLNLHHFAQSLFETPKASAIVQVVDRHVLENDKELTIVSALESSEDVAALTMLRLSLVDDKFIVGDLKCGATLDEERNWKFVLSGNCTRVSGALRSANRGHLNGLPFEIWLLEVNDLVLIV